MKLLFATTNPGKLREVRQLLADFDIELLSLDDFPQLKEMEVEETGTTFYENALLKAKTYGDIAGVLTVAEDAGLAVDALNGEPGVYSARYAPTADERNAKLLRSLEGATDRTSRFISVLSLYNPETGSHLFFDGQVEGKISLQPTSSSKESFGYDPVFIPSGYENTFAELGSEVKNKLSHRAIAMEKLKGFLSEYQKS